MSEPAVFTDRKDVLEKTAPPLTKEEIPLAASELIKTDFTKLKFPRVTRLRVDPVPGNRPYCLHTFIPSKNAKPDSDGVYGIMKCRGNFATHEEADSWAQHLITNIDSNNEIQESFTGREFPVTVDDKFFKIDEIDIAQKMTQVTKDDMISKKKDDNKTYTDMKSRQKELMEPVKDMKESTNDDLEFYTTLRVKRATLRQYLEELEKKESEVRKLISEQSKSLKNLDKTHPEYKDKYKTKYLESIKEVGADEKKNEIIKYLD